jgi:hypothetical protein
MLGEEARRQAAEAWAKIEEVENARRQRIWKTVKVQNDWLGFFVRIFSLSASFSRVHVHVHWKDRILLNLSRGPMLFSERNGYSRSARLPFGWRLKHRD